MSNSKRQSKDEENISLLVESLKNIRSLAKHKDAVYEITGEKYTPEKAQQFLVYLVFDAFGFSDDYNITLASWGLLDGIGPNLGAMDRRAECAKQFGYNKGSLSSIENRCYGEIERKLLKNGFVIDEEKLDEKVRIRNKKKRDQFIAEAFSGKFDIQVPARPYRVNDTITKHKDKTGLVYPKPQAVLNEVNIVPEHTIKNPDKVPSFPLAASPNTRFTNMGGIFDDLKSQLEQDLDNLQYTAKRLVELEPAAKNGNVDAQYELGEIYYKKQRYDISRDWYLAAAQQNHVMAQVRLGALFIGHPEWDNSASQALYWAEKAARQGNPFAQYLAGHCYHYGIGTEPDHGRAVEYYKKSLAQGQHSAANNLGLLYLNGRDVPRDYTEALRLFKIAFDDGIIAAAHNIGTVYRLRTDPAKDIKIAIKWFEACAESGYIPSQLTLGMIYFHGDGVEPDYQLASYWLKIAADQGDANAQHLLGYLYQHQLGVDRDYDKAFYWFGKSAKQGFPPALIALAQCYSEGIGVKQDDREALKLLTIATDSDSRLAESFAGIIKRLRDDLNDPPEQ